MKLTDFQLGVLGALRVNDTRLGRDFDIAWSATNFEQNGWRARYEAVMDIKSPLIDRVRAHLVACTLTGTEE